MTRRNQASRWRRFALITGATLCALLAAAFVVSAWCFVAIGAPTKRLPSVHLGGGSVMVLMENVELITLAAGRNSYGLFAWNRWSANPWRVQVPLYAILVVVAIPTLLVWRLVPRFPRGHCRRCGYNLKGLTEPRCPECGKPFESSDVS